MENKPRVLQFVPSFKMHDGIADETMTIHKLLQAAGYTSIIYSNAIVDHVPDVQSYKQYKSLPGDIVILHMSVADPVNDFVAKQTGKKIMIFHNFTPAKFFEAYETRIAKVLGDMDGELKNFKDKFDVVFADTNFNKGILEEFGYKNVKVLPIIYDNSRIKEIKLNEDLKNKIKARSKTNILFVGRVAPNKAQIDLVRSFYIYRKYYNKAATLYLVGNTHTSLSYLRELLFEIRSLKLEENVVVAGEVSTEDMYTYYSACDLFVSMSEHEGFFIPSLECFHFSLPMILYGTTASNETPGDAAAFVHKKDYGVIAEMINMLIEEARRARESAYAPYSRFKVGAAALGADGRIYTGCNVENIVYGLTNCAERTAIFKAVSEGVSQFKALAVFADTEEYCSPCGACRQVMSEFGKNIQVIRANKHGEYIINTADELLPDSFSAALPGKETLV